MTSPCMQCGACCATFRVAFYWAEAGDAALGLVPAELTRKLDPHRVSMIGTDVPAPRCLALRGDIGQSVSCSIYPQRPSPCRDFEPFDTDGNVNPRCSAARARWKLPPLAPVLLPDPLHSPAASTELEGIELTGVALPALSGIPDLPAETFLPDLPPITEQGPDEGPTLQ